MSWGNRVLDLAVNGQQCPVWIDSRDTRCGKTDLIDGRWCKRHTPIIQRKLGADRTRETEQAERRAAWMLEKLPEWRAKLARVEAEIARLDPPPPTTDTAAYGGVGSTTATHYRERFLRNLPRLAELAPIRDDLAQRVRIAESFEAAGRSKP